MNKPPKPKYTRYVAIPSSLFREVDEPLRTLYAGLLARALAIYRVEEVTVYIEGGVPPRYLADVLEYLRTPPYLRKKLFPRKKTLRFIGVAPPLASPNHPLRGEESEYREALVIKGGSSRVLVDAGLDKPVWAMGGGASGEVVVVRRAGGSWVVVRGEPPFYWSYSVAVAGSFLEAVTRYREAGSLIVAASRRGVDVREIGERLRSMVKNAGSIALFYGLWARGLYEVAREEGVELEDVVDAVVNFIPNQGVRTVRTVEAVHASLAIVNTILE